MIETFLALLTGHLLADFVLQTKWMVQQKKCFLVLLAHILIVVVASILTLGSLNTGIVAILSVSHFLIDAFKTYVWNDKLRAFIVDQAAHFGVIAGLAYFYPDAFDNGYWNTTLSGQHADVYLASLTMISAIVLAVPAGGILIGKMTEGLRVDDTSLKGLEDGGRYIGWLERALVLLLLLMKQPEGIGFLVAAKSLLRFGDIRESADRKITEYVIIGTFLSFGWALLIGVCTQQTLERWYPEEPETRRVIIESSGTTAIETDGRESDDEDEATGDGAAVGDGDEVDSDRDDNGSGDGDGGDGGGGGGDDDHDGHGEATRSRDLPKPQQPQTEGAE